MDADTDYDLGFLWLSASGPSVGVWREQPEKAATLPLAAAVSTGDCGQGGAPLKGEFIVMFDAGTRISKARRLLRAALPLSAPPPPEF